MVFRIVNFILFIKILKYVFFWLWKEKRVGFKLGKRGIEKLVRRIDCGFVWFGLVGY